MRILLLLIIILTIPQLLGQDQQISFKVKITNLKNTKGSIIISVFEDQKGFKDEVPVKREIISKKDNMQNGVFTTEISLKKGK